MKELARLVRTKDGVNGVKVSYLPSYNTASYSDLRTVGIRICPNQAGGVTQIREWPVETAKSFFGIPEHEAFPACYNGDLLN
jgi:hypothetical protein